MTPKPRPIENEERRLRALLALVLLAALAVRVWMALCHPRFYDDHYVFLNVQRFLDGVFTPRHSYYGTLSYLPQSLALALCERLQALTGIAALAVRGDHAEGFSLFAYRLMRMFIVAYGVLSLALVYRVGRRLFSPQVGLVAAALLAAYPQHIRSSIQLKPDMLTLLLTLVTLSWTIGAVKDPRLGTFLRAGVGVGLATSAKYYGAASCLPLTVWSLVSGFGARRRWLWLPLAGLASLATFALLNPFPAMVLHNGQGVVGLYSRRARSLGSGHWDVFRKEIEFLAEQHGWVLGAFLVAGTFLLLARLRRKTGEKERNAALLTLGLYLGYTVLHAAALRLFYPHNFMPVLAGTSLTCGYALVAAWHWLAGWRWLPRARASAWAAAALLGAFLLLGPFEYAYARLVPDTWAEAGKRLAPRLAQARSRHLAYELDGARFLVPGGEGRARHTAVPSLARLAPGLLDLADAEAFPLRRVAEGPDAPFYRSRRARLGPECSFEVSPETFRLRGEELLVVVHPWMPSGDAVELPLRRPSPGVPGPPGATGRSVLVAPLPPGLAVGEVYSLDLTRPNLGGEGEGPRGEGEEDEEEALAPERPGGEARLLPGGGAETLIPTWVRPKRVRLQTLRFRLPAGVSEVEIPAPARAFPGNYRLRLWRWTGAPCAGGG